jgi:ubiquinone/menaquinone biosynthesis C-methylase UbiE
MKTNHRADDGEQPGRIGVTLHSATLYDFLVWMRTLGRERVLRERMLSLARPTTGESVLDVGCGTGTLAIAAKRRVGPTGNVFGIDASPEMLARAQHKATRAGVAVKFEQAVAQKLPFRDGQFEVVWSTLMLHHLPRRAREECLREMRRVATPGGRVLVIDFSRPAARRQGLLAHFHRHGHTNPNEIIAAFASAGLVGIESGALGTQELQFVLATAPGGP